MSWGLRIIAFVMLVLLALLAIGYLGLVSDKTARDRGQRRQECIAMAQGDAFAGVANLVVPLLPDDVRAQLPPELREQVRTTDQAQAAADLLEAADSLQTIDRIHDKNDPCP